jgi:hypothetical protein
MIFDILEQQIIPVVTRRAFSLGRDIDELQPQNVHPSEAEMPKSLFFLSAGGAPL